MNTRTGNVFPQFHCLYNDDFATCERSIKFESHWQHKAKLASRNHINNDILVMPTLLGSTTVKKLPEAISPLQQFVDQWDEVLMDFT